MVRVSASGGGGPGFNPHHIKLSGLAVRPLKVSGGSPVHLRSKHQELVRKTLWVKTKKTKENRERERLNTTSGGGVSLRGPCAMQLVRITVCIAISIMINIISSSSSTTTTTTTTTTTNTTSIAISEDPALRGPLGSVAMVKLKYLVN